MRKIHLLYLILLSFSVNLNAKHILNLYNLDSCHNELCIEDSIDDEKEKILLIADSLLKVYDYSQAIDVYKGFIEQTENESDNHSLFLTSVAYNQLCTIFCNINIYDKAIIYGEKAYTIRKNLCSMDNENLNRTMFNLGCAYLYGGKRIDAEILFSKIYDNAHNYKTEFLSELTDNIDKVINTISLIREFCMTMENTLGEDNETFIEFLTRIPRSFYRSGRPAEALNMSKKLIGILERKNNTKNEVYALAICNAMYLNYVIGNYKEALDLADTSMMLINDEENTLSMNTLANLCHNLGIVWEKKDLAQAIEFTQLSKEIYETLNYKDEEYRTLLQVLSSQLLKNNDIEKAEEINDEALSLSRDRQDTISINYGYLLADKACITSIRNLIEGNEWYKKSANVYRNCHAYSNELVITENIIRNYYEMIKRKDFQNDKKDECNINNYLDSIITYLGRYNSINEILINYEFPKLSETEQRAYREQICSFYDCFVPGLAITFGIDNSCNIPNIHTERNKNIIEPCYNGMIISKGILQNTITDALGTNDITTDWNQLHNTLKENEIIIDLFHFNHTMQDTICYAYITEHSFDTPQLIPLATYHEVNNAIVKHDFQKLYNLIWSKIEIGDVKNIYLSTNGIFNKIGIEYALDSINEPYSRKHNIYRISSHNTLINKKTNERESINDVLLWGNLNYDYNIDDCDDFVEDLSLPTNPLREGLLSRSGFDQLQYTSLEISNIEQLCKNNNIRHTIIEWNDGTEAKFNEISQKNYDVIHIATHGMYVNKEQAENIRKDKNLSFIETELHEEYKDYSANPLSRVFLVMSGGNMLPKKKSNVPENNDGILSGKEIAKLNLNNTDLVVLSACESGIGDISNEGVLGLQFAFKKAGVKSLLISLDNVDDKATQLLMTEFYKSFFAGYSKVESLQRAQKQLQILENGKYKAPKYWASFILIDAIE